jgi:hypothetical protein
MLPDRKGVTPRYGQRHFSGEEKRGRLRLIISPDGRDESLSFYQDTRVYAGLFDGDERAELRLDADRYAYVHVIRGSVALNGTPLNDGDGVRVRGERRLILSDGH